MTSNVTRRQIAASIAAVAANSIGEALADSQADRFQTPVEALAGLKGRGLRQRWSDDLRITADDVDITGTSDASSVIQRAIFHACSSNRRVILPPGARLRLNQQLVGLHGRATSGDVRQNFRIVGNASTLIPNFPDYALWVKPLAPVSRIPQGDAVAELEIVDGLAIDAHANAAAKGLRLGMAGYAIDGFKINRVEDILTVQSQSENSYLIDGSVRHIEFQRLVGRDRGGLVLRIVDTGGFQGDLVFSVCEFSGSKAAPPLSLSANGGSIGSTAQLRGVHFTDCVIYGSGTTLTADAHGMVGDIWFNGPQFDGPNAASGEDAIAIVGGANSAAQMFRIYFNEPYIVNYRGYALRAQSSGADLRSIKIVGGDINEIDASGTRAKAPVYILNSDDVSIEGVGMVDNICDQYVNLDGVLSPTIRGNKGYQSAAGRGAPKYGVTVGNACKRYDISHNMLRASQASINDNTSGTPAGAKIALGNVNI